MIFPKIISFLDGYAALVVVDPSRVEKMIKNSSQDDIQNTWKQAKDDVGKIAGLPSTNPKILRLAKILGIVKTLFMFIGLIGVLIWVVLSYLRLPFFVGADAPLIFVGILFGLFVGSFVIYYYFNRRLTLRVNDYYEKHSGEIINNRRHLRTVTQQLIDKLTFYVRRHQFDPKQYEFTLYHPDYKNVKIVKEDKGAYFATVAARTASSNED